MLTPAPAPACGVPVVATPGRSLDSGTDSGPSFVYLQTNWISTAACSRLPVCSINFVLPRIQAGHFSESISFVLRLLAAAGAAVVASPYSFSLAFLQDVSSHT